MKFWRFNFYDVVEQDILRYRVLSDDSIEEHQIRSMIKERVKEVRPHSTRLDDHEWWRSLRTVGVAVTWMQFFNQGEPERRIRFPEMTAGEKEHLRYLISNPD